jgi:toxin-antitoxin system PIN domain toxin
VANYLLDASVLIALAWEEHSSHDRAGRWFAKHGSKGWASCPITQAALVRTLSNPSFSPRALTPSDAMRVLERNLELSGHHFWSDSISLAAALKRMRLPLPLTGHRQITDAYLVALAMHNRGKLATLDGGIAAIAPDGVVEVIAV